MHEFNQHTKIDQNIRLGKPFVKKIFIALFDALGNFTIPMPLHKMVFYFFGSLKENTRYCFRFFIRKNHKIRLVS